MNETKNNNEGKSFKNKILTYYFLFKNKSLIIYKNMTFIHQICTFF